MDWSQAATPPPAVPPPPVPIGDELGASCPDVAVCGPVDDAPTAETCGTLPASSAAVLETSAEKSVSVDRETSLAEDSHLHRRCMCDLKDHHTGSESRGRVWM